MLFYSVQRRCPAL